MPRKEDQLHALLEGVGHDDRVIDAVMRVDALMQHWRRRMIKRELGRSALAALELEIDFAQLDVLFAIAAPHNEFGAAGEGEETMVSTVAERLAIDPSRASRVVAEMVAAGYAVRTVSQADARRTILELTPAGWAIVRAAQGYKWLVMGDFFAGWSEADIKTFVPLFERFLDWTKDSAVSEAKFADEIAGLVKQVEEAKGDETGLKQAGG